MGKNFDRLQSSSLGSFICRLEGIPNGMGIKFIGIRQKENIDHVFEEANVFERDIVDFTLRILYEQFSFSWFLFLWSA